MKATACVGVTGSSPCSGVTEDNFKKSHKKAACDDGEGSEGGCTTESGQDREGLVAPGGTKAGKESGGEQPRKQQRFRTGIALWLARLPPFFAGREQER